MFVAHQPESIVNDIAERIYNLGRFDVNAVSMDDISALSYAIKADNLAYIKWLLQKGANYNAMKGKNPAYQVPVWVLAANAKREIFDLFTELPGIDLNAVREGVVLRYLGAYHSDYEIRFRRLMELGATLNYEDVCAIMSVNMIWGDYPERISMLLEFVTEKEDLDLEEVLESAKENNCVKCVEFLEAHLKKCGKIDEQKSY